MAKAASARRAGSAFEKCRVANKAAYSLWSGALEALALPVRQRAKWGRVRCGGTGRCHDAVPLVYARLLLGTLPVYPGIVSGGRWVLSFRGQASTVSAAEPNTPPLPHLYAAGLCGPADRADRGDPDVPPRVPRPEKGAHRRGLFFSSPRLLVLPLPTPVPFTSATGAALGCAACPASTPLSPVPTPLILIFATPMLRAAGWQAIHALYKIARAGSLVALAEDCASYAVNKDLGYVALRDGGK